MLQRNLMDMYQRRKRNQGTENELTFTYTGSYPTSITLAGSYPGPATPANAYYDNGDGNGWRAYMSKTITLASSVIKLREIGGIVLVGFIICSATHSLVHTPLLCQGVLQVVLYQVPQPRVCSSRHLPIALDSQVQFHQVCLAVYQVQT